MGVMMQKIPLEVERAVPRSNLLELISELVNDVGLDYSTAMKVAAEAVLDQLVLNAGMERSRELQMLAVEYTVGVYQAALEAAEAKGVQL